MKFIRLSILALGLLNIGTLYVQAQQTFYDRTGIQKIEIFFHQENWDQLLDELKYSTDGYLESDSVRINGTTILRAGVKFKGNSSYDSTFQKNPFTIKLDKFQSGQSYQGVSEIKLSNCYQDPSMIREVLSYAILGNYMIGPRSNFAQVYVNNDLKGLYSNVEDVNKTFCARNFNSLKSNTFIKGNPVINPGPNVKSNLKYLSNDSLDYFNYYELKSDYGWIELMNLCDIASNRHDELPAYLDMDRMIWMLAFDNVMVNLDSYIGAFAQNYFLFKDNHGIFNPIVWDLNMSLGGFPFAGSSNNSLGTRDIDGLKTLSLFLHENDAYWPVINAILSVPTYRRMYLAHVRTLSTEMLSGGTIADVAEELHTLIDTAVVSDKYKFFSYTDFQNSLTNEISVGTYSVPGIISLMNAREEYILSLPEIQAAAPEISAIQASFDASLSQAYIAATIENASDTAVFLGFRLDSIQHFSRQRMFDDGAHNDAEAGDGIFGAFVDTALETSEFYIYAENEQAGSFSPERAEHEFYTLGDVPPLSISPVQESNSWRAYPNPTRDLLYVNMPTNEGKSGFLRISDLSGRTLLFAEMNSHTNSLSLKNMGIEAGLYLMNLELNGKNFMQKILIE